MWEAKRQITDEHDLATLLGSLASRLRRDSLALIGMASQDHEKESVEFRTGTELAASAERIAEIVDLIRGELCQKCRLKTVVESLRFMKDA